MQKTRQSRLYWKTFDWLKQCRGTRFGFCRADRVRFLGGGELAPAFWGQREVIGYLDNVNRIFPASCSRPCSSLIIAVCNYLYFVKKKNTFKLPCKMDWKKTHTHRIFDFDFNSILTDFEFVNFRI